MSDRYNTINREEPHGQSVAENGIPCTAKINTKTLKNIESMEAVTANDDIHVLMNLARILKELIEIIESGKFDIVEKSKKEG